MDHPSDNTHVERVTVPELDHILGQQWPVLDRGFIRVVDYLGSDASIVQAARVSYGAGTKSVHEDAGLIRYLMRHRHTTPFEMCEIKLHVRVPMDTWRQWVRHRTASLNETSTRYSIAIDQATQTTPDDWRLQATTNRQGSAGFLDAAAGQRLSEREAIAQRFAREVYEERLAAGVAREQARKDLPLSTYTEAYWKIDLHNLLHFLSLRMDEHAQLEIRAYANIIGHEIVRRWCPITWQAFLDYRVHSLTLSALEIQIAQRLAIGDRRGALRVAEQYGWLTQTDDGLRVSRECREAEERLHVLGLQLPWWRDDLLAGSLGSASD